MIEAANLLNRAYLIFFIAKLIAILRFNETVNTFHYGPRRVMCIKVVKETASPLENGKAPEIFVQCFENCIETFIEM